MVGVILVALAIAAVLVAGHVACVRSARRALGHTHDRDVMRRAIDRMEARK